MSRPLALAGAALAAALLAFAAPGGDAPVLPATPYAYDLPLPAHLAAPPVRDLDNTPAGNPLTDAGATLGRVLFYDTRLSADRSVSCASCHRQANGFSDPAQFSAGVGGHTPRHSMGLAFARYYGSGRFFWDERAPTLEAQVLMPVVDPVEMGATLPEVVARLEVAPFYPPLFAAAFGTPEVTPERMARALAQFVRSIVGPDARYDQARINAPPGPPGQPMPGLTPQENLGLQLFFGRGRCSTCHRGDLFAGDVPRNNGLDATTTDPGAGDGRFKAPSLRNVALSAPYMHDGRFPTLEAVVDHYDAGVQPHPHLDPLLRTAGGLVLRLDLTPEEHAALVAFLRTLTDPAVATDPRWSDPFPAPTAAEPAPAAGVALEAPAPNPARGGATLTFRLAAPAHVALEVFDAAGRRVATLAEGPRAAGPHAARWDAAGLPAGRYLVRLTAAGHTRTRPLTLLR